MDNFYFTGYIMDKKIKAAEVAAYAGVSAATVSRVINNSGYVKSSTYKKITDAMKEMGYEKPEHLPTCINEIVIFLIPAISNPFSGGILNGLVTAAKPHGYDILIYEGEVNHSTAQSFMNLLKKTRAVGVVSCCHIPEQILKEINSTVPIIQCCEYNSEAGIPYVTIDDVQAAKTAVEYLASTGRKRIAMINASEFYSYSRLRLQGYKEGLEASGLEFHPEYVVSLPEVSSPLGISAAIQILKLPTPPDAFFVVSDVLGAAVVRAAHKLGMRVPEDVAVIGFDNIDLSTAITPPLTTINQSRTQIGFSAFELLLKVINGTATGSEKVILDTELIIRETT